VLTQNRLKMSMKVEKKTGAMAIGILTSLPDDLDFDAEYNANVYLQFNISFILLSDLYSFFLLLLFGTKTSETNSRLFFSSMDITTGAIQRIFAQRGIDTTICQMKFLGRLPL
jgi:hypothetical protein